MSRGVLIWVCAVFALPAYWTGDKALQKYAVWIASSQVLEEARDPTFWIRTFNLKTPLRRQAAGFHEDDRLDSNQISRRISGALGGVPFDHEFLLALRDKSGKRTWYSYHLTVCGEKYCPFDVAKFQPTQAPTKEELHIEYLKRNRQLTVLGYPFIVIYEVGVNGAGGVLGSEVHILDSARNPVDRILRQLSASRPPDYWRQAWRAESDLLLNAITER